MADTASEAPSSDSFNSGRADGAQTEQTQAKGWGTLKQHVIDNKVLVGMWATRIFTILFSIGYIIPLFG